MASDFRELASVDGTISPTAEAMVPLKDDGLYRGDGAFEVIRLYEGRPFALGDHLDRLGRSAAAIELEFDRAALEREIEALLAELGDGDGQLRLIVTRGGRRIAATEPIPPHAESVGVATVTYAPSVILNGVKSLSYAANMQATRIAKAQGADEAVLVRPDGTVLEPPTSSIFWVSPEGALRTTALERRGARVDHPRPPGQGARRRGGRMAGRRPARRRRGLPRLDHARDPGRLGDRRHRASRGAGPPHPRGPGRLRRDPRPRALNLDTESRKQG